MFLLEKANILHYESHLSLQQSYINLFLGNVNDDLDFEFGPGTNARSGCGVTFMDRFWYFGGTENQVNTKIFQLNYQFLFQIFCLHVNDFFRVLFLNKGIDFCEITIGFLPGKTFPEILDHFSQCGQGFGFLHRFSEESYIF